MAIVDHGLGNIRSVLFACEAIGVDAVLTADPKDVEAADAVILPGVGAFGDAVSAMTARGLDEAIRTVHERERPVFGICLGLQLLGTASVEFGRHEGLGIVSATVRRLDESSRHGTEGRVPVVGWRPIERVDPGWARSPLSHVRDGEFMYFVHSYHLVPEDPSIIAATAEHAGSPYCAAISVGNVFACQFHPERSGSAGLQIYRGVLLS